LIIGAGCIFFEVRIEVEETIFIKSRQTLFFVRSEVILKKSFRDWGPTVLCEVLDEADE
jgi:hypothetical protein